MLLKTLPTIASNKPKYTKRKDLQKRKRSNPFIGVKQWFIGIMGEEIDYDNFKKTNKWAIRIQDEEDCHDACPFETEEHSALEDRTDSS